MSQRKARLIRKLAGGNRAVEAALKAIYKRADWPNKVVLTREYQRIVALPEAKAK